jgi:hypothetical protein
VGNLREVEPLYRAVLQSEAKRFGRLISLDIEAAK